jgi:hypothetical protein
MGHSDSAPADKRESALPNYYGPTFSTALLLTIFPDVAVIFTVPTATAVATPPATVATDVLLEVQVAAFVISVEPLHVCAVAVKFWVCGVPPTEMLAFEGSTVMELIQPTVTLTVCVPVIDGFLLEVAVTVAVPVPADVTKPVEEIVATVVGVMVQETDGLLVVLPSLLVPNEVICTVLLVFPVSMVGEAGPTEIVDRVGLTKNPVQLVVSKNVASMAKAQTARSFPFIDDIVVETPWARFARVEILHRRNLMTQKATISTIRPHATVVKIVAEENSRGICKCTSVPTRNQRG